jgi:uncharacterized protein with GYD domain
MSTFSITGKYAQQGFEELASSKASGLETRLSESLTGLGGKLVSLYFSGATYDIFAIVEVPSTAGAAVIGPLVGSMIASGAFVAGGVEASLLLAAEEADTAISGANK